ncbi:MAG: glycosyltransferase family 2 protein [Sulfuricella sp.]|nr:glycosyltransferase family 2 protein [Sulfuricella sp.]
MKVINESVSIIIPAYQEGEVVGEVVANVLRVVQTLGCSCEVLVIDDGSTDNTGEAARQAGAQVLVHPYNRGYGASLKTGIRAATGRTVIFMDADGQHDPEDIRRLLADRQVFDMVVGARRRSQGSPMWRKPGKLFLGLLANNLTGRNIPDLNSGFRALDREMALRFLPIMPDGFSFSTTSTIAAFRGGYTVHYVPIQVAPRVGKSTVTVADGFKTIMLIIRIVTLFAPLRVFMPVSMLSMALGVGLVSVGYWQNGAASLKGIMVILASILFFLFGILVDQVTAIRRGEHIS